MTWQSMKICLCVCVSFRERLPNYIISFPFEHTAEQVLQGLWYAEKNAEKIWWTGYWTFLCPFLEAEQACIY